jgi:hypothetical protein
MTERWMTEKCLPPARSFYPQLPWHDAKLYFSVIHFSVMAFVQANLTLPS